MLSRLTVEGVQARAFRGVDGEEHYLIVQADPGLPFDEQLTMVEARHAAACRALGLSQQTWVFRRLFLSDILNQAARVDAGPLGAAAPGSPVAVSMIEQAPMNGAKVAMLAYHIAGQEPLAKRRISERELLVTRNGWRHLWSTRLCQGDPARPVCAADQTRHVFDELTAALAAQGANLADHCVRTWLYVKDVDVFYPALVRSRSELFARQGLTENTHYIASTGIQGACAHVSDVVAMDAYSMLDLKKSQLTYLNDFSRMCATHDYQVTFERGARLAWRDRAQLFISGTASIDAHGRVAHPGDVRAQLERALGNVEALLDNAGASLADMTHLIVYLRDPGDWPVIQARLARRFEHLPVLCVHGPVCRPDWLIEVEGLAIVANHEPRAPAF